MMKKSLQKLIMCGGLIALTGGMLSAQNTANEQLPVKTGHSMTATVQSTKKVADSKITDTNWNPDAKAEEIPALTKTMESTSVNTATGHTAEKRTINIADVAVNRTVLVPQVVKMTARLTENGEVDLQDVWNRLPVDKKAMVIENVENYPQFAPFVEN